MIYKYFVSYTAHDNETITGCGRLELTRNCKIKSIEDIESIEELISKKYGHKQVLVSNYILLSKRLGNWK